MNTLIKHLNFLTRKITKMTKLMMCPPPGTSVRSRLPALIQRVVKISHQTRKPEMCPEILQFIYERNMRSS